MTADTKTSSGKKPNPTVSGFGPKASESDKHLPGNSKANLDKKLDTAGDESFPGSDPVSVKITK